MLTKNNYSIYAFFDENGVPFYFGISRNMPNRVKKHRKLLKTSNLPKYQKVKKLLKSGYSFLILILEDKLTEKEAKEKEVCYISIAKKYLKKVYNLTDGGDGGDTFTNNPNKELIRKKISASHKGKNYREGCVLSPEHKRKISVKSKLYWKKRHLEEGYIPPVKKSKFKKYKLTSPTGEVFVVTDGLEKFAIKNGLNKHKLSSVVTKKIPHHKNWRCEYL